MKIAWQHVCYLSLCPLMLKRKCIGEVLGEMEVIKVQEYPINCKANLTPRFVLHFFRIQFLFHFFGISLAVLIWALLFSISL